MLMTKSDNSQKKVFVTQVNDTHSETFPPHCLEINYDNEMS